ncbi:MAG: hypothetical protein R3310_11725 [Candidatus Competibacteraceae bacterium]|nr:hypothetical protein [Candidatus Competibacteraceae bacterium]
MYLRLLSLLAAFTLTAACGPIYETRYSFTPPPDPGGLRCISQCEINRQQCRQFLEIQRQNCLQEERISELEYHNCLAVNPQQQQRCQQRRISCGYEDQSICDEQYRYCYQGCGGAVEGREVCVFNCS